MEALGSTSPQERVIDGVLNYVANRIARIDKRAGAARLRFCEVATDHDWRRVRELRKRCYPVSLPYLAEVLDADGSDPHDRHSFVYAAFVEDRALATIRATTYPYETLEHLGEAELAAFLGDGWKTDYVEWGRLLVDPGYRRMRLTPALITYAGFRLLMSTPYRSYFGYTRQHVRTLISSFAIDSSTLPFQIPSRGDHHYLMTKGSLSIGAIRELPRWLRHATARRAGMDAGHAVARAG
ncbi:MAG TPA: hypothetical protein VNO30_40185 [Kofleriaceae bacterium]|nr:hypothetical protein [Kofleriaceae bacterium]